MGLFLLGILFDETMRRWVIPWIRRGSNRGYLLGRLCGTYFKPASTDGMVYMSGGGESFTDALKEEAAKALVESFASELMSGSLGPVEEQCRAALNRHLALHKKRADMMGWGFHNPFRRARPGAPQIAAPPLPGPTPDNPEGDAAPAASADGGGDAGMVAGMMGLTLPMFHAMHDQHRRHHPHHPRRGFRRQALMGWNWNPFASSQGRQAISLLPGGAAATQAHDLVKRGRHGDQAALTRIAHVKHKAAHGDRHAKVALNHIKKAHTNQTGQHHAPTPGGGQWRQHYATGSSLMHLRPHRAT